MKAPEPDIFVYKMVVDNGGAPCVEGNLLSLALCKPKIRQAAQPGALIFGFGGKPLQERLIYIARVTKKLEGDAYYRLPQYAKRSDCIYQVVNGQPERKATAKYHTDADHRERDVGSCFQKAFVLLSEDFRYLGRKGTDKYKSRYPKLAELVEGLRRGHRRFHSSELRAELLALKEEIWSKHRGMKVGQPSDKTRSRACHEETPSAQC